MHVLNISLRQGAGGVLQERYTVKTAPYTSYLTERCPSPTRR